MSSISIKFTSNTETNKIDIHVVDNSNKKELAFFDIPKHNFDTLIEALNEPKNANAPIAYVLHRTETEEEFNNVVDEIENTPKMSQEELVEVLTHGKE